MELSVNVSKNNKLFIILQPNILQSILDIKLQEGPIENLKTQQNFLFSFSYCVGSFAVK